jgi:hypothetical protein
MSLISVLTSGEGLHRSCQTCGGPGPPTENRSLEGYVPGERGGNWPGGDWENAGFDRKIADRIQHENRSPIFPERFLIGIVIAITIRESLIDFKMKIGDRF